MDLTELCRTVAGADAVAPVGARTHWEVGGPPPGDDAVEVRAPRGVVRHEPADMTVTVGAGTSFAELDATLAEHGQQCALDPRSPSATVGGILACGLSGVRRLRHGPVRDQVLEVRFVTAEGRLVKGGGPTVKNVTGYDLPRLLVGSFGTLGVIVQATLRCWPRATTARWFEADEVTELHRPSSLLWDGHVVRVLLEGTAADVDAQSRGWNECDPPALPDGAYRGRVSVEPGAARVAGDALDDVPGARWCAELGVGTVHVAGDDPAVLHAARGVARANGGWLLREAGDGDVDGFGLPLPNLELARRIKAAFDPAGKLSPGRLSL